MKTQSSSDAIYAAGFFDGEGCVAISKRNDPLQYQLVTIVGNTDESVLQWWVERFGGSLYTRRPEVRPNRRQLYSWEARSRKAAEFLKQIQPYVRIKRDQIDAALEFQATIGHNNSAVPKGVIARREMYYQTLKGMKREPNAITIG